MKYNYTIVLDHKPKIIIPYTDLVVRGRLFLIISFILVSTIHLPFFILMLKFDFNIEKILLASFILMYILILAAVQNFNAETGNYVVVEKIKILIYTKMERQIIIVDNKHKILVKNKKVHSKNELSYLNYL